MNFSEYTDLLELTRFKHKLNELPKKEKLDSYLDKIRKNCGGKPVVKSNYKTTAAIYPVDLINATKDLEDPEIFAKVIAEINKELCKNGNPYDISNDKVLMLGLTNRYIDNAQIAKYNRQWRQFAFYMRAVAYYIPQLLLQAGITDANFILTASSKKTRNKKWFEGLPKELQDFVNNNKDKLKDIVS